MFYGILIRMYIDDHNPPHIYAKYGENDAMYNFDGEKIDGEMPKKQEKYIVAWIDIHKDELIANWQLAHDNEPLFKIEPLK